MIYCTGFKRLLSARENPQDLAGSMPHFTTRHHVRVERASATSSYLYNLCLCICLPSHSINTIYLTSHPLQPNLIYVICSYPYLPMGDSQNRNTPNHHWFPCFETNWMILGPPITRKTSKNTWSNMFPKQLM